MKKTISTLSIAAAAAMSFMASSAQAQSSVTIYGIVDVGLSSVSTDDKAAKKTGIDSGLQSQSRIGFKGTEDLGQGLKVNFVIERGINAATGDSTLPNRQTWVGLSHQKAGEVRLGYQFTPMRDALENIDPFKLGTHANAANVWGGQNFIEQAEHSAKFQSVEFAQGFKVSALYAFGEKNQAQPNASRTDGNMYNIGASYENYGLNVDLVYQRANLNNEIVAGVDTHRNDFLLGAKYNFGPASGHLAFGNTEYNIKNIEKIKSRNYLIGVSAPFGPHEVAASYVVDNQRTFDNADSKQFGLGYSYNFSKRTNAYASYAHTNNEANAFSFNGKDANSYAVGLRHKF